MESSDFKIIKRFGPSVLKVKIPKNIIETLNNHFDKVILDKSESKRLNHGEDLVGDVTQELKLEKEIMQKSGWANFLASCKVISKFEFSVFSTISNFLKIPISPLSLLI